MKQIDEVALLLGRVDKAFSLDGRIDIEDRDGEGGDNQLFYSIPSDEFSFAVELGTIKQDGIGGSHDRVCFTVVRYAIVEYIGSEPVAWDEVEEQTLMSPVGVVTWIMSKLAILVVLRELQILQDEDTSAEGPF